MTTDTTAAALIVRLVSLSLAGSVSAAPLGRDADGRPLLVHAGQSVWFGPGVVLSDSAAFTSVFAKAGIDTIVLNTNLGMYHSRRGYVSPLRHMREFWRGPREYDPAQVEAVLAPPVQANPQVKIILWLGILAYPEFCHHHPESIIRNDRGDRLIATNHFIRFDPNPPPPGKPEHEAVSFFAQAYRTEAAEMLEAFVRAVQASAYGSHVIGYLIGGGQDGQQYSWSPPDLHLQNTPENWGDYSGAAKQAFVPWLRARYHDDLAALNKAWQAHLAAFEEAAPPPATELCGARPFHDPLTERRAYDFKRFLAEGRADFIIHLARALRGAAGPEALIGASGGDGGHRRDNTSISRLLRSDSLDFYLHQATYGTRIPPSTGGINAVLDSYAANGKIFLTDMDHRLFTSPKPPDAKIGVVSFNAETVGWAADLEMQRAMWRREFARLWVSGNNGAWSLAFARPQDYDHPGLQEEVRFLRRHGAEVVARHARQSQGPPAAEVAFVCDEEAVDWARVALSEVHHAPYGVQWREAHLSGAPCRFYYAQDLRDGKIPAAKLYVLQNLLDMDAAVCERVRAALAQGATVVVLQGTGVVQLARGEGDDLAQALGLKLRRVAPNETAAAAAPLAAKHPLLQADQWLPAVQTIATEALKEPEPITLTAEGANAAVLGLYPQSKLPAIVTAPAGEGQVVFVGAYLLSKDLISRLARLAGAWRVASPGVVVAADDNLLMLHPMQTGEVDIRLRQPAALMEYAPGHLRTQAALTHRLQLAAGKTYLFDQKR